MIRCGRGIIAYIQQNLQRVLLNDNLVVSKSVLVDCFYSGSFALMLARSGKELSKLSSLTGGDRTPSYKSSQPKTDISYLDKIIFQNDYEDISMVQECCLTAYRSFTLNILSNNCYI